MARRRLYGETQKRRKKKQTQALKRQGSVTRVQSTHQPAPFQRSGELDGQDVAFLEAMRDMGVRGYPRDGEAPERLEKFQAVQFAAEQDDAEQFLSTMERMGVKPLANGQSSEEPPPAEPEAGKAPPGAAKAPGKPAARQQDGAHNGTAEKINERGTEKDKASAAAPEQAPATGSRKGARKSGGKPAATTFRMEAGDGDLLDAVLDDSDFDPAQKFAGAPAPPKRKAPPRQVRTDREPDAELDLHGKTQEEAIRMVQGFLLTSYHRHLRHVLIITGKGLRSGEQGPVLRDAVYHWLERNGERFAKSFGWAPPRHGGQGAIWVTLR